MSGRIAVTFTKNNARVLLNPPDLSALLQHRLAIVDPDMSHVKDVPPHFWKFECGMLFPMNLEEQAVRLKAIKEEGVDNCVITPKIIDSDPEPQIKKDYADSKKTIELLKIKVSEVETHCLNVDEDLKKSELRTKLAEEKYQRIILGFRLLCVLASMFFLTTTGVLIYVAIK